MSVVINKDQDERPPVKTAAASKQLIQDTVTNYKNELTAVGQRSLAVEQERSHLVKDMRKRFDNEYQEIQKKISDDMQKQEENWNELLQEQMPLVLQKKLEEQKKATEEIVNQKLQFIKELENEVMKRDHEYVNKITAQKETIDNFVNTMRQQEKDLKEKIASELQRIQSSYELERSNQIIQIEKEVNQLSSKRQERENALMNEIRQLVKTQRDSLEALRQTNSQEFMVLRTSFETKLQAAQKEYEDRLAQYQFSFEQLDYDFRILQENEKEHEEKVKLQGKKKSHQRDILRNLRERYNEQDKRFEKQNQEITNEYKRIASSYRELQTRFRNVAYTDFNAFREVWNLNEKRLHDLVLKVLDADRIIRVQELGKEPLEVDPDYLKRWIIGTDEFEDLTKTPQAPQEKKDETTKGPDLTSVFSNKALSEPLEHLRRMISDEVGFLVDERVKSVLGFDPSENLDESTETIRLEVLFKELGISEPEDVEQLLSHFIKDSEFGELENPGFVRPHEVLEGLRNFVDAYHPNRQQNQMSLFNQISQDATQNTSSEVSRAIIQLQKKMRKELPEQRKFWEKKADVVTEDMWRLWNATFKGIQRYVKELEERAKLIEETDRLKHQNEELKVLLSQYLESDSNQNLIYAPEETVDFEAD